MYAKKKIWLVAILLFLSAGINVYFRLQPLFLKQFDKIARGEVYAGMKNEFYKKISTMYPDLPEIDKFRQVGFLFKDTLSKEKAGIRKKIRDKAWEMKRHYQDEEGWTYLLEVDPYRWWRRVNSFLNTGHFGKPRPDNQEYDDLMSYPAGAKIEPLKLHFYLGAYLHRALRLLNHRISLFHSLGLHPVLFSPLLIIAVFAACLFLGNSALSSFIASLVIGLSNMILMRTGYGWFDTDIYNVSLPVFAAVLLAYALRSKGLKHRACLFASGLIVGIHSGLWSVWWLVFYILLGGLLFYEIDELCIIEKKQIIPRMKRGLVSLFFFIASVCLSVLVISGPRCLKALFQEPFILLSWRGDLSLDGFWPGLVFSISELQPAAPDFFLREAGGLFILGGGITGLLLLINRKELKNYQQNRPLIFILSVWLIAFFILTAFTKRFIVLLLLPLGIFFSVFLDAAGGLLKKIIPRYGRIARIVFLCAVAWIPLKNALALKIIPEFNDSWQNICMKIKEHTPEGAVVGAWWDEGDYFMTISQRPTFHDAQFQHSPVPYWFARALYSSSEEEALGIFRMLCSGKERAFTQLSQALNQDKLKALKIINQLVLLDEAQGRLLLNKYIQDKEARENILKLTYAAEPALYLAVYDKLARIAEVMSGVASWDFTRLDLWKKFLKSKKKDFIAYAEKKFSYSAAEAEKNYHTLSLMARNKALSWISRQRLGFREAVEKKGGVPSGQSIFFPNGIAFERESMRASYYDAFSSQWIRPQKIIFFSSKGILENTDSSGDNRYALFVSEEDNAYRAFIFDAPLAQTLFFRLYFLKGQGLKHFKLAQQQSSKYYPDIYLYQVVWNEPPKEKSR